MHGQNVGNSSFDVAFMRKPLLVSLQLGKSSSFPKTNKTVYGCRSVPLFFNVYCSCRKACFHDDITSDDGYFIADCSGCEWYHKNCMKIPV